MKITLGELEKLEGGSRPDLVNENWECETIIVAMANKLLTAYSVQPIFMTAVLEMSETESEEK